MLTSAIKQLGGSSVSRRAGSNVGRAQELGDRGSTVNSRAPPSVETEVPHERPTSACGSSNESLIWLYD